LKVESIFDKLGGASIINVATELFYKKILADPYINFFFKDLNMTKQLEKQKSFLTKIFGGPHKYTGENMRHVHRHLVKEHGLDDTHFDQLMSHLRSTLAEVGIEKELIHEAMKVTESFRNDVLNKPTSKTFEAHAIGETEIMD